MNRVLLCIVLMYLSGIFAQDIPYDVYAGKTKEFAKNIYPFAGRIFTYSENNKDKQVFYTKALLALNNAETAHLSVKNLNDLLVYCSYSKRLKKDSRLRKDIVAYGHRRIEATLTEITKRFQWASDQVRKDETAGIAGNLTTILRQFVNEYNKVKGSLDELSNQISPKARQPVVISKPEQKSQREARKAAPGDTATVLIFSIPPNAKVYMDGSFIGKTNIDKLTVTPGAHRMQFTVQGKVLTQEMTFNPGDNGKMFVTIE